MASAVGDDQQNMPFVKHLASSDRKTREKALSTLRTFLAAAASPHAGRRLQALDSLKLWKGLFYSLWMCDRPLPQQNLCAELAGLLLSVPGLVAVDHAQLPEPKTTTRKTKKTKTTTETSTDESDETKQGEEEEDDDNDDNDDYQIDQAAYDAVPAVVWLRGFWETLSREWTGIDVLRMEKFLLLVRRVVAVSLAWTREDSESNSSSSSSKKQKGSSKATNNSSSSRKRRQQQRQDALLSVLASWPLDRAGDLARVPVGLRLHFLDLWVDEADKLGILAGSGSGEDADGDVDMDGGQKKEKKNDREEEEEEEEDGDAHLINGIRRLVAAQRRSPSKPVRARALDSLDDGRLPWNAGAGGEGDEDGEQGEGDSEEDDGEWGGFRD